jgi:type I restriction enzyme M protein
MQLNSSKTSKEKSSLNTSLWDIANFLRGKMNPDEFRDYILGFIFYKYLSDKQEETGDEYLKTLNLNYKGLINHKDREIHIKQIKTISIERIGYFLEPEYLFSELIFKGNQKFEIIDDLKYIFSFIQKSTLGQKSEDDFANLFDDIDLDSNKLGKNISERNALIFNILSTLNEIDLDSHSKDHDILGDAYEYLISQFAASAGKKAGEFYTPQKVSTILAKIVTLNKKTLKSVYDPTCGSGSLLLRVAKENIDVKAFYGQELNTTTYNLARMNMIMHNVHYSKFDIKQDDTLKKPQHLTLKFEAIVANPPFSAHWSADASYLKDPRFASYDDALAPKTKADLAFIQHMLYHLDEDGVMASVLPHGVLFRSNSEQLIRKRLIELNHLDTVISLPANLFYGVSIAVCVLVLKKKRENTKSVLFIDASQDFEKNGNKNTMNDKAINKIMNTYEFKEEIDNYSRLVSVAEIQENEYNLNVPRYISTKNEENKIDLLSISQKMNEIDQKIDEIDQKIFNFCNDLNIPSPLKNKIKKD